MTRWLVGDIGGTHARLALFEDGALGEVADLPVATYPTVGAAIEHFLAAHGTSTTLGGAVVAGAGPVANGRCVLTNAPWTLDERDLAESLGVAKVIVVNDLVALAWALPDLRAGEVKSLGGPQGSRADEPLVVVAPGTGLGMACLLGGPHRRAIASEGGHASLPAADQRQAAVIEVLRRRHGHVSAERILSGPGLSGLYAALAELAGQHVPPLRAEQISHAGAEGSDPLSREALDMFCSVLGAVAGNAALTFGATGGVFIGGGIAPGIAGYLARSGFRTSFEAKGRLQPYLATIPTGLIVRPDPAFVGLAALATAASGGCPGGSARDAR